ncbi:MAG: hypothetical protein MUC95_04320 [Spirochaetes bacterium]|jgi:DNA polymerase-4|nr:hypothetical protein [Spirochaetota bacterium]
MKTHVKKIVSINIPHIFLESEKMRGCGNCIIASGTSPASAIIDAPDVLRKRNIRRGMPVKNAKRLASDVNIVTADFDYMREINWRIIDHLKNYSITVESSHFGEFYIDLTGTERLFGRAIDTCGKIIGELCDLYGFNSSAGIGANRLVAYLASRIIGCNSAYEICAGSEYLFLEPMHVSYLPGIPREVKNEILYGYNIRALREMKAFSKGDLAAMFGETGSLLYDYSRNISADRLVQRERERIVKQESIFAGIPNDDSIIRRRFFQLVLELCVRMRAGNIIPLRFSMEVVYKDDYTFSREGKLRNPSFVEKRLYAELLPYLEKAIARRTCLRKIVLSFSEFIPAVFQQSLFPEDDREIRLSRALDSIRKRYGRDAIYFPE